MEELIKIAIAELGVKEIKGRKHNTRIIDYAKESGFSWINDDETPWCSIFMNWCAQKANLDHSKKANARSWLNVGIRVVDPEPGDVVVFWRESRTSWKGHVGIFMGYSKDATRIYTLGGNQGNQVSLTAYSSNQVLQFRRLTTTTSIKGFVPDVVLKKGDRGDNVKLLQDALKMAGFDCGTSDGIYGGMTENAVKELQATIQSTNSNGPTINGKFDKKTRTHLVSLLSE